jgi:hypothetical protein
MDVESSTVSIASCEWVCETRTIVSLLPSVCILLNTLDFSKDEFPSDFICVGCRFVGSAKREQHYTGSHVGVKGLF